MYYDRDPDTLGRGVGVVLQYGFQTQKKSVCGRPVDSRPTPRPRSSTLVHTTLFDQTFLMDGPNNPPYAIAEHSIHFSAKEVEWKQSFSEHI